VDGSAFKAASRRSSPYVAEKWFDHDLMTGFVVPPSFAIFCSGMLARALWRRHEYGPLIWSVDIFLGSLIGLAASLYPYPIPRSVTAMAAASGDMTLVFMILGIGMLIPVMIACNARQYLVFRRKVRGAHYS
jgi:cytochrome bd ubiquinol oxidase subunit II